MNAAHERLLDALSLNDLLDVLGWHNSEFISLGYGAVDGFHTAVMSPADVAATVVKLPKGADIYFGVNPVAGPARTNHGRGTAEDVTRLAALYTDLDVKPGACSNLEVAHAVIGDLSALLGTRPSAITHSGNGLHPYWPINDDGDNLSALMRRWGRLVAAVAEKHGAQVDSVYDLARMLRVPGTLNNKTASNGVDPKPVVTYADTGGPLTVAEIDERLNEYGVYEESDDTGCPEQISNPAGWRFTDKTCTYVGQLIDGLDDDGPLHGGGRHQWVLKQTVRLACAVRLGCVSENDWRRAQEALEARLIMLRAATGQMVPRYEVPAAFTFGIDKAATKTDDQCRVELGHTHSSDTEAGEKAKAENNGSATEFGDAATDLVNEDDGADKVKTFKFPDGHRPTDVGNAARLLRHAGGRLRYVHAWGKWIVYQNGRWIIDEKDALASEAAKAVARGLFKLAAKTAAKDPDEAKPIWAWALKSDTSGAIAAMVRLARGVDGIIVNHEDLDADPWLLNVTNGTVDVRTGKLQAHNPADLCTMQAPVAYDPHATAPLWESCVARWQPDDDVRGYVQVRAGAGATGIPTETVDIDYGHGGNGKSKFHGAIQHVLGPYTTVPHKSLLVAGRFEQHATVVADLFRKRLAVASETKQAEDLDDESVKNLTGGDRLKGRRMREDPWEFWPTHTLVMFSNHKPTVAGRDEGIWRRLRLVPWEVTIPEDERDEGLAVKLAAEAPGILRWIIDGARRFHAERLIPPPAVRNATAQYRADEDVVGRFIAEVLEFAPHTWCYSVDIKNELDDWCAEQDITAIPRMNDITATLRQQGGNSGGRKQVHGKRSTIWHGVSITQKNAETS